MLSTAGLSTASLGEDPPEPPKSTIDINVTGVLYTTNLAFYYFKATRDPDVNASKEKKHLLLIGSLAGYGDHPLVGDYTASKWAVRGLWKSIRGHSALLGGVRMNLLAPTWINAGIAKEKVKQLEAQGIKAGETADVVAAVLRCCCDETIEGIQSRQLICSRRGIANQLFPGRAIAVAPSEDGKPPGSSNFDLNDDAVHGEGNPALLRSFAQGVFGEGAPAVVGLTKDDTMQLLAAESGDEKQKNEKTMADDDATENEKDKKDNGEEQSSNTSNKNDKPSEDDQIQNESSHTASSHPPLTSGQHKAAEKGEFQSGLHGEGYGKSDEEHNKDEGEGKDQDVPVHGEEIDRLEEMGVQDEEKGEVMKAQDEDEDQVDLEESAEGKEARGKMSDQEEEDGGKGDTTGKKGNRKHASEDDNSEQSSKKRKENK